MKLHDTLEEKLDATRPTLTPAAKAALFARIETALDAQAAAQPQRTFMVSPYVAYLRRPVALLLVLVLCVTTFTTAAQAAKPGDALFPVEQLSEELRYLVTPAGFRGALREAYAEQRLHELKQIVESPSAATAAAQESERLSVAVAVVLAELDALENDTAREAVAAELLATLNPQTLRARIENDRFELRDDNVRIRFKDGEWRYRYNNHREDDDSDDGGDDDNDDRDDGSSGSDRDDDRDDNDFRWRVTDTSSRSEAISPPSGDGDGDGNHREDEDSDDGGDDDNDDRDDDSSGSDRDDDRDEDRDDDDSRDDTAPEDRDGEEDDASGDDSDDRDDSEGAEEARI